MESPISPFIETKVTKKVALEPFLLNNDILYNIKNKLKNLEGMCHRFGYLQRVQNILEYDGGIISPEDLMCKAMYSVSLSCIICNPIENTFIIGKVRKIDPTLISSELGPIQIITQSNRLSDDFKVLDGKVLHIPSNEEIVKGTYVHIKVLAKRFNTGDQIIKVIGNIVGFSSEEQFNQVNRYL